MARKTKLETRKKRHRSLRKRISGTPERPRLVVFRSAKHIYAQIVDDDQHKTLVGVSSKSEGLAKDKPGKVGMALAVGKLAAARAKDLGIKRVVFDRAGYHYHGRVKAIADGAREGGLEF